jgi:hypothetical protein
MKKLRLLFPTFVLMMLACNALTQPLSFFATPTPTVADIGRNSGCPDSQPTQKEIDFALQFKDETFKSPGWKSSYAVMEYRVRKTWENKDLDAVVNMDHIIFCGATDTSLDDYYTSDNFDLIFQHYFSYEQQRDCRSADLRLYELKVNYRENEYNARFWVELVDGNHTRETLLVFPIAATKDLDSYSKKIMPGLPSCK